MPNMLAHLGVGGVATRCILRRSDAGLIFLGCVIPDVPWILQRVCFKLPLPWEPYDVRLYFVVQASLAGGLLLAASFAAVAELPRRVFTILSLNVLIHLVLDACQTKWGSGIHFLAPFSWDGWNFGLFWPESVVTYALTAFGAVYYLVAWFRFKRPTARRQVSLRRILLASSLLLGYFLLPLTVRDTAEQADVHYVKTLRETEARSGKRIELDRGRYRHSVGGEQLQTFAGEVIDVVGSTPPRSSIISLKGVFRDSQTVELLVFHLHQGRWRDWASLVGLAAIAVYWLRMFARMIREARRQRPPVFS